MTTWTCQRDGACCTQPEAVVMTTAEWRELANAPAFRPVVIDQSRDGWVALKAHPCPYYDLAAKACSVYDKRPMNCRRFLCGRWNAKAQPFMSDPMPLIRSNNDLRWTYAKNQRAHEPWALAHGWKP